MTARLGDTPLLVRGLDLPRPSLDELRAATLGTSLWAIEPPHYGYVLVDAAGYFDRFVAGTEHRNIVDHYLEGPDFAARFPVPALIADDDLLRLDPATQHYRLCLVATPGGVYTANHVDGFGLAGWLYLAGGEKEWELVAAADQERYFDPMTREYWDPEVRPAPAWIAPHLAGCRRIRIRQRAGELVYIPAAALHRVRTLAPSWGWGGSFLPRHQLPAAAAYHRFELRHWPPPAFDFRRFVAGRCAAEPATDWAVAARRHLEAA